MTISKSHLTSNTFISMFGSSLIQNSIFRTNKIRSFVARPSPQNLCSRESPRKRQSPTSSTKSSKSIFSDRHLEIENIGKSSETEQAVASVVVVVVVVADVVVALAAVVVVVDVVVDVVADIVVSAANIVVVVVAMVVVFTVADVVAAADVAATANVVATNFLVSLLLLMLLL